MEKITLVNSFYPPTIIGGAEISTSLLAEGLTEFYKVSVITSGEHRIGIKREIINNVSVYRLPNTNIYWPAKKKKRNLFQKMIWHLLNIHNPLQNIVLRKVIKEINPDIVNTQNLVGIGTYIWKLASVRNIKLVHTLRDYGLYELVNQSAFNNLVSSINKKRSMKVNSVVGISNFILKNHSSKNYFQIATRDVIPNVVTGTMHPKKTREDKTPIKLGYFGMLEVNKGVDFLVKTVKNISSDVVGEVVICGEGSEFKKLKDIAGKDNRFQFLGKIPYEKTQKMMVEVDLTVVPSRWQEPFGRVIIESYQQGTPVLGTKVGGIPEIINEEKYLIESDNESDLILKIMDFYSQSSEEKLLTSAKVREESRKYNSNIQKYIEVYKR